MKLAWPRLIWCAGVLAAFMLNPALGQAQQSPRLAQPPKGLAQEGEWCLNETNSFSSELQIKGCTAIIEAARNKPEFAQTIAISFFMRGIAYYKEKNFDAAIADETESIRLDPQRAGPYNSRGMAYAGKGDLARAIADFTAAIKLDANFAEAYSNRGYLLSLKGDHEHATADLTAAVRLNPGLGKALWLRGIAHLARGENIDADLDIGRAIEIDPLGGGRAAPAFVTEYLGIPATAKTCPLTVKIETQGASVFVYTRGSAHPVRFDAPDSTKDVPLNGPYLFAVGIPESAGYTVGTTSPPGKSLCS